MQGQLLAVRDPIAFVIRRRDVALRLQRTQGFTHRHPADLEGIGNGLLRKPFTRFKSSVHDGCAQRFFNGLAGQRYRLCQTVGQVLKHLLSVQFLRSVVNHVLHLFNGCKLTPAP
ncbi:hypothetical protein ALP35_200082 [Pseudomonas savastanoi pv. glycinea]|nr:hypothetical protein ALP35_200082 [Pseudomonas savastanoi pv. glycinea]